MKNIKSISNNSPPALTKLTLMLRCRCWLWREKKDKVSDCLKTSVTSALGFIKVKLPSMVAVVWWNLFFLGFRKQKITTSFLCVRGGRCFPSLMTIHKCIGRLYPFGKARQFSNESTHWENSKIISLMSTHRLNWYVCLMISVCWISKRCSEKTGYVLPIKIFIRRSMPKIITK